MRQVVFSIILMALVVPVQADEAADLLAKQKKAVEAALAAVQLPPQPVVESPNLLLAGPLSEARLKALSATLEKQYAAAIKALQFEGSEKPLPGKLAVYVFDDRTKYRSFVRAVAKASPDDDEQARQLIKGDTPFVAVGPGRSKDSPAPEAQAGYQVAIALLGVRTRNAPLPEWASLGFAKATAYQASGASGGARKKGARDIVARRGRVADLWSDKLSAEQKLALGTSVMDFLVYGKGVPKPIDVISAMRPEEEKVMKSAEDVFGAVKMTPDQFEAVFLKWLRAN
ncbi:MAG: hypothetical protein U0746_00035 [Gemmataceae bacterium]